MDFIAGHFSAVGISKPVNQDSICLLQAIYDGKNVFLAVICDGMGGMDQGETASAFAIRGFVSWFETRLPTVLLSYSHQKVIKDWKVMLGRINDGLCRYGNRNGIKLGTTLSSILIMDDGSYVIGHVGDSRIYEIREGVRQLTEDQSLVADEARRGIITWQQARKDKRRNILLECLGISAKVNPMFHSGKLLKKRSQILLCSDGFYHELSDRELSSRLGKGFMRKQDIIECLKDMEWQCEKRGEQDNITAALICCIENGKRR